MSEILVVDDNEMTSISTSRALTKAGYNVTTINDSREAVKLLERFRFDLIITDVVMPFISGVDVIRVAKSLVPQRKVLAFSSMTDERTRMVCYQAGAEEFMSKPVSPVELTLRVRHLIGA